MQLSSFCSFSPLSTITSPSYNINHNPQYLSSPNYHASASINFTGPHLFLAQLSLPSLLLGNFPGFSTLPFLSFIISYSYNTNHNPQSLSSSHTTNVPTSVDFTGPSHLFLAWLLHFCSLLFPYHTQLPPLFSASYPHHFSYHPTYSIPPTHTITYYLFFDCSIDPESSAKPSPSLSTHPNPTLLSIPHHSFLTSPIPLVYTILSLYSYHPYHLSLSFVTNTTPINLSF